MLMVLLINYLQRVFLIALKPLSTVEGIATAPCPIKCSIPQESVL
jgi:hypothetical protein